MVEDVIKVFGRGVSGDYPGRSNVITNVLIREKPRSIYTDRRGRGNVTTKAETGVTQPQTRSASHSQQPEEEWILSLSPGKSAALPHPNSAQ